MDAYKVGVSIVLANGVSPVLAIIGKDLLGLKTSVKEIEDNMGGWKAALIGVGLVLTGSTILGAMTELVKKSADFQDAMTKVSQLNPKVAAMVDSGEMKRISFEQATRLGMNVEDVTKVYGGIFGAIQDTDESKELLPYVSNYARLMEMRHPGSHPEDSIRTLLRAGEDSGRLSDPQGRIDPEKVKDFLNTAARLEAATHGQVNADVLFQLAQQGGGVSLRGLSQEGYEHMAIVAQMIGGGRAGTSLLSLRQQMTGTMFKRNAEAFQKYGLLKDGEWTTEGGHVSMTDEAKDRMMGLVNKDPMNFVNAILGRFDAMGITDPDKQMEAITELMGRQTTSRMVSDMYLARAQIARETKGLEQGVTVDEGLKGYDGNIHAAQQNVDAAWHNLAVAIGGGEGERFAAFLNKIASAVNWVTDQVNKLDPDTIDAIFKVIAGFAMGLITIGTIIGVALAATVLAPLISGAVLIGGVVAAIVAAVMTIVYLDWDKIKAWFTGLYDWVSSLAAIGWDKVSGWFNGIGSSISGFIDWIGSLYNRAKSIFSSTPLSPSDQKTKDDLDRANSPLLHLNRFDSGVDRPKAQPISLSLNVDGRTLAQSVSSQLAELMMFPTGAGAPDHWGQWADAGGNTSST